MCLCESLCVAFFVYSSPALSFWVGVRVKDKEWLGKIHDGGNQEFLYLHYRQRTVRARRARRNLPLCHYRVRTVRFFLFNQWNIGAFFLGFLFAAVTVKYNACLRVDAAPLFSSFLLSSERSCEESSLAEESSDEESCPELEEEPPRGRTILRLTEGIAA